MLLILAALGVEWLSELCQVEVAGQDTLVLCSDRGSLEGWIGNSGGVFCKKKQWKGSITRSTTRNF